jgi:hypothetical protein
MNVLPIRQSAVSLPQYSQFLVNFEGSPRNVILVSVLSFACKASTARKAIVATWARSSARGLRDLRAVSRRTSRIYGIPSQPTGLGVQAMS